QVKIFGDYVRFFFDMPCPTHAIQPQMVLTTIDQAVHRAKGSPAGPVHINCMFREPLNPQKTKKDIKRYLLGIGAWEKSGAPFTSYTKAQKDFTVAQANEILPILTLAKSGVIVVGKISREEEREQVLKLAEKLNWPVFPDITSGLRFKQHPNIISFYDQLLLSEKFQRNFKADCVLHLGGRITSKRWYQYVEKVKPKNYIMVLDHPLRNDPLHNVTVRVEAPILKFSEGLLNVISLRRPKDKFLTRLHLISQKIDQTIESFIAKDKGLSEITASRLISLQIKEGSGLFLASSLPIREVDMYAAVTNKQLTIESNRGASGIDGTIASATGFLNGINKPATLLIGDLAFLHDLNSLALLQKTKHPLVIVVLNNNGGGIFSFLPVAQTTPHFEKYFGTSHGLNFKAVRDLFDLNYANPKTKKDFTREYAKAFRQSRSTIIEITTGREDTYKEHKDLQQHIVTVVDRLLSS
ncbi:MAG: 2-succinyl-5-enolpyruvyl-6-hydroxy-3-cyclohexene-1-carboxylic-acid synthase, partial [Omnitrophica WOR_2 bacterium GWA2_47_8]